MIQFSLSQEQIHIVERLVASGRYEAPQTVIGAALSLLENRERERLSCLEALQEALVAAENENLEGLGLGSADSTADGLPSAAQLDEASTPFDAEALDEIERLIASRAPAAALA